MTHSENGFLLQSLRDLRLFHSCTKIFRSILFAPISDVFGPTIKSENIPGTPMESIDALLVSESIDMGSTSDSSLIHDASLTTSNQKSQMARRSSGKIVANDNGNDNKSSHTMSNSIASSQLIENERGKSQRPSISSIDGSKRPTQEVLLLSHSLGRRKFLFSLVIICVK